MFKSHTHTHTLSGWGMHSALQLLKLCYILIVWIEGVPFGSQHVQDFIEFGI